MRTSDGQIRFSVGISTFVMAMVLVSSVLVIASYYRLDTSRAVDRTVRDVGATIDRIEVQAERLTDALGLTLDSIVTVSGLTDARTDEGSAMRAILASVFARTPSLTAGYVGYDDGRFLQVVSMIGKDAEFRAQYRASADAANALVSVSESLGGARFRSVRFFDQNGKELNGGWSGPTTYDPRDRPWYTIGEKAGAGAVRTRPYVFGRSLRPGITVARRLGGTVNGMAGVDLDLQNLSELLAGLKLTPSTRLAIVDDDGLILAHTEINPVNVKSGDGGSVDVGLRHLTATTDPLLAELASVSEARDELVRFTADGAEYFGRLIPIGLGAKTSDRLLIAVPWQEIAAPVYAARNRALLVTGGLAVIVLGIAILIARRLARPLERLTEEAQAVGTLAFSDDTVSVRSPFAEIQQLGDAMRSTKSALSIFARYVPRSLVSHFIESGEGADLGGVRRDIALMFTDIKDFTTITENADSALMMRQLSEYFECVSNAILDHNGTIDKYIGDAVMAFWNAPRDDLEMASNACKAALAARDGLAALNIKWD
ncbi:MAG: cache domain-containing protein, partial [Pseudomonadota bacterium]